MDTKKLAGCMLAFGLFVLGLSAGSAASGKAPKTPAPAAVSADVDASSFTADIPAIMALQDYGFSPVIAFKNPETLEGEQLLIELYRFPRRHKARGPEAVKKASLLEILIGSPDKDAEDESKQNPDAGPNPTQAGMALLKALNKLPAEKVAKITNRKLAALLLSLRDYALRIDDPKYQVNPGLLAGYESRIAMILDMEVPGDTDYAGLGKQGRSLRDVLKARQDALRAALDHLKAQPGPAGTPMALLKFMKQVDDEMTTMQIGVDGSPLIPSTLVQLVSAIPEAELTQTQWRTLFESYPMGRSLWKSRVDKLWRGKIDGEGVTVAVLDTGVDKAHPFLQGRVADGLDGAVLTDHRYLTHEKDAAGQDLFGRPDHRGEHATHVASTILAYAPKAKIINLKVLDEEKATLKDIPEELHRDINVTLTYIAKGLQTVYEHNQAVASGQIKGERIDVVNMSLGANSNAATMNYDELSGWVKKVSDQGVVVVVAAGNEGMDTLCRPGIAPEALTVGAVDYFDRTAKFSSSKNVIQTKAGRTYDKPDIWAYGVGVDAAKFDPKGYARKSPALLSQVSHGTSMATPHVAGITALLIQEARRNGVELTPAQVKKIFQANANPLADGNPYLRSDSGVIDPVKAVEFLKKNIALIKKLF